MFGRRLFLLSGKRRVESTSLCFKHQSVEHEPNCQEDRARLFSAVPGEGTRSNGHKLKHKKFQLNMRKNFFTLRVMEHWNWLPREVVESPSLVIFKTCLDKVLCNLL